MFLKRIEMQGFKSFANKTMISFEHPITGVVGPNGCGKSNIFDAVRWVLGEQSAKSMRGERMNDVIFSGSQDRRMMNIAEVTLIFDNTDHVLNTPESEVEVTRSLKRDTSGGEYMINHRPVRLKDIVDLFLDTGIGKDSLSIISQGNIASIAEAKPLERRGIFEEAAGVAKYKKRKLESLAKLERTKNNLERSHDILFELEKQVGPLKRQAKKALIYKEKKDRLEEIEINVLVHEIDTLNDKINSYSKQLFDIETSATMYETSIQVEELKRQKAKESVSAMDKDITKLQTELMDVIQLIASLESQKTKMDERSKYLIETGTQEQKAQETRRLLETAKTEYIDRKERYDSLNNEIELTSTKLKQVAQLVFDAKTELEKSEIVLRTLKNKKETLDSLAKDPFGNARQSGAKAIIANKNALEGILGVVGQELIAHEGYEMAISEALGGAMFHIVTSDEVAAREAIKFLNRNKSGRATFLPVNVLQPRDIKEKYLVIAENFDGFLGVASEFVDFDEVFEPIVAALLDHIMVVDSLEAGNELARLCDYKVNLVTTNGEIIHRGGSMTGGKVKNNVTPVTLQKEIRDVKAMLDAKEAEEILNRKEFEKVLSKKDEVAATLQEKRIAMASLEPVVDVKRAKYEKLKNEMSLLDEVDDQKEKVSDEIIEHLVEQLNDAYNKRDLITSSIKSKNEERMVLNQDLDRKEAMLRNVRKDLDDVKTQINQIKIEEGKLETKIETDLQRLASAYRLTYEFAKTRVSEELSDAMHDEVNVLRHEIERLGNVNMEAPQAYEEINTRYETLKKDIEELEASRDTILNAIDEMDGVMKVQFKEMFDKINVEFDSIFKKIYGGGKANLVLVDPSDILNTGIDIDAQPPGKAVQNNMLFSGGEKSLIALCVLFAILKVKPVPLVILDEVEAALDPSNVERFAQYLHEYTNQTQFIVVTHRSGTMRNCDILYGVTMQQQGVSQMLKVDLKDAEKFVDGKD